MLLSIHLIADLKVFKQGETDSRMRDVFKAKCRLGYEKILDRRNDIRMRFGILLDAGIAELTMKDIEYLGEAWLKWWQGHSEVFIVRKSIP